MRKVLLSVRTVLVATEYMRNLLLQNGFATSRIKLLAPHVVPSADIAPFTSPELQSAVAFAGRLEREKGVDFLLAAMSLLPSSVQLLIAGDGSRRSEYEALAERLALRDRVKFLGWKSKSELIQLYRSVSLAVMPSIFPEPFGKSGIEALTEGRPVVAFAVGGIQDWLKDGVTGLLAQPADSVDLSAKIWKIVNDPEYGRLLGTAGQQFVRQAYSPDTHLATLQEVLSHAVR